MDKKTVRILLIASSVIIGGGIIATVFMIAKNKKDQKNG